MPTYLTTYLEHFYRVFQSIENIFFLISQSFMTCENNLSSYIYVNKRINSYLQKNWSLGLYRNYRGDKKLQISPKKLKNTRQPKVMYPQNFAQKKITINKYLQFLLQPDIQYNSNGIWDLDKAALTCNILWYKIFC